MAKPADHASAESPKPRRIGASSPREAAARVRAAAAPAVARATGAAVPVITGATAAAGSVVGKVSGAVSRRGRTKSDDADGDATPAS